MEEVRAVVAGVADVIDKDKEEAVQHLPWSLDYKDSNVR